jgi:hypothetical protein
LQIDTLVTSNTLQGMKDQENKLVLTTTPKQIFGERILNTFLSTILIKNSNFSLTISVQVSQKKKMI